MVKIPNVASRLFANAGRLGANVADAIGADGVASKVRTSADNVSNPSVDAYGTPRGAQPFSVTTAGTGVGNTGDMDLSTTSGGAGGGGGAAINYAAVNSAKGSITSLVNNIKSIYDALYGDIAGVTQEQQGNIATKYSRERDAATDQFNTELPKLGYSYAARGVGDSSFRQNAEIDAGNQFAKTIEGLNEAERNDTSALGKYLMTEQANINAQKSGVDSTLAGIAGVTDVDQLQSLVNTLQSRIQEVTAQRAGAQRSGAYVQAVKGIAPGGDNSQAIRANLTSIVNGLAPAPLKRQAAGQILNSSGLSEDAKKQLLLEFNSQIQDPNQPAA